MIKLAFVAVAALGLAFAPAASAADKGLSEKAEKELRKAGLFKYLGDFRPASSTPFAEDWVKHSFDPADADGPKCIDGSEYSMFTKAGHPDKLIVFLQGGGACWEGLYQCNVSAAAQFPPPERFLPGLLAETSPDGAVDNPFADWSVAYFPYCDGSVFVGDNDVEDDPRFGVRHHRGLRNLSAGLDVARETFKHPEQILVTGSSAGGVGAAVFAPFLARKIWGDQKDLFVLNDAGPIALDPQNAPAAAAARVNDWKFDQFFPQSCVDAGLCDPFGQQTGFLKWRLDNDLSIREGFYSTDADLTNRGFASANVPGFPPFVPVSQFDYRMILETQHNAVNAAHPDRYRRFIVSGANPLCFGYVAYTHTALQGGNAASFGCLGVSLYYDLVSDGTPFNQWAEGLISGDSAWQDIVEPFFPAPPLP